ncbi:diguanylate cyclase/phosphodiesterase (plasmid) [Deinococcus proteolyticus MRP]|uniref:Diguanylate cyclase/phosphodiesterase n=1 Tax=Deinococcus proteolyticus (strain ATCC 35074 / DSM 20540 / JCM 6276 / NBRC 101906 / NCIMB 13154 / VKM Ac-1939 / CCM 2703 / MRP) TaxID=693977 RepID=F0RQV0_DEIPM|nr:MULTISPECIES: EAL domain-containing protein [Deinococcus]ADY27659.1 diguanylate cyclase/phosphodiesterase [Deinococcus proteolyticus MRP]MCY1703537.1 EAL domain-containing protein [Deinococcus sp. SL84]
MNAGNGQGGSTGPPPYPSLLTAQELAALLDLAPATALAELERRLALDEKTQQPEELIHLLALCGAARLYTGDYLHALHDTERAAELARTRHLPAVEARATIWSGVAQMLSGQLGLAFLSFQQALLLVRSLQDTALHAEVLGYVGRLHTLLREEDTAEQFIQQAQQAAESLPPEHPSRLQVSINLAHHYLARHAPDQAREELLSSLPLARRSGVARAEALLLLLLGQAWLQLGQSERAQACVVEGLTLSGALTLRGQHAAGLFLLGKLHAQRAQWAETEELLQEALTLSLSLPSPEFQAEVYQALVEALRAQGRFEEALAYFERFYAVDAALVMTVSDHRAQVAAVQLQVERLRYQADEERKRRKELDRLNAELRESQEKLSVHAAHDDLTPLLNRRGISHLIDRELQRQQAGALLLLDLDHFKQVNDVLGHDVGDAVLQEVARRIQGQLPPGVHAARIGGDEFVLFFPGSCSPETVHDRARAVLSSVAQPLSLAGRTLKLDASGGLSFCPADAGDQLTLYKHADLALYSAKEQRSALRTYTADLSVRARERLEIEQDLRQALQGGEFELYYQPVIDVRRGVVSGAEALLRWNHPHLGLLGPQRFIPVAEQSDLIVALGDWVIRRAVEDLARIRAACKDCVVSVNVSPRQLLKLDFTEELSRALSQHGLTPGTLTLELTEETALLPAATGVLAELREQGFRLALDDVGRGHSNWVRLAVLPAQLLKIDQEIMRHLTHRAEQSSALDAVVRALVTFAHNGQMQVVAEGVETREQLRLLRDLNCDFFQGFLAAEPLPLPAFLTYLLAEHWTVPKGP